MLTLRPVADGDEALLWDWANDPVVREWSWSTVSIAWSDHQAWFRRRMAETGSRLYVGEVGGLAVGQIRFDIVDRGARVGVSVAPDQKGRGYGVELIRQGTSLFFQSTDVVRVVAEVKANNIASSRAFLRAGYSVVSADETSTTFEIVAPGIR